MYFIYIVTHRQTISLHHNSPVWIDTRDASSWDRNPADFKSVGYLNPEPSSFSALVKEFLTYPFFIYFIGYSECLVLKKNYQVSASVVAGKLPH